METESRLFILNKPQLQEKIERFQKAADKTARTPFRICREAVERRYVWTDRR